MRTGPTQLAESALTSTWPPLAQLLSAGLPIAAVVAAVILKGAPEVRLYLDRREKRRSQAQLVSASVERSQQARTAGGPQELLMIVVVTNDGDRPISHVEVNVPSWGWTAIPFSIIASKPRIAGHSSVSQGMGFQSTTWTPSTCGVRYIDHQGRGWTQAATGRLRRDWRTIRWTRRTWSRLVLTVEDGWRRATGSRERGTA